MNQECIDDIEFYLFVEGIFQRYGYDFRDYAQRSLKRRVYSVMENEGFSEIGELTYNVIRNKKLFQRILPSLTVSTSMMFRDPNFFLSLRKNICPRLHTYPRLIIWHAGCSTGEEVYSLAILLKEEGLYDRSTIFATDINPYVLKIAQDGIYQAEKIKDFTLAYQQAGGRESFSKYYAANYGRAKIDRSLIRNVTFMEHNLVTDSAFTEAHLILCRNVFIYFNHELQDKVAKVFLDSLVYKGILGLGSTESVRLLSCGHLFDDYDDRNRIFQKNTGTHHLMFRA